MKRLIVSPQAGMCNRFRAICSAVLIARISGRKLYHNWDIEPPLMQDIDIIKQMRSSTLANFFEPHNEIPFIKLTEKSGVDRVFSEWGPQEGWFQSQRSAICRCKWTGDIQRERDSADAIINSSSDTVLLETSLTLKPSWMRATEYNDALTETYRECFQPVQSSREFVKNNMRSMSYVGVHIRRMDHLRYVPEANLGADLWAERIKNSVTEKEYIFLCSDDKSFASKIASKLPQYRIMKLERPREMNSRQYAFIEFLILSKASRIYGTAGSSFSAEAARFGAKPLHVCSVA